MHHDDPADGRPEGAFESLCFRFFDQLLSEAELAELNALLRASDEARDLFTQYAMERFILVELLASEQSQDDSQSLLDQLAEIESHAPQVELVDITGLIAEREHKRSGRGRSGRGAANAEDTQAGWVLVIPRAMVLAGGMGLAAMLGLVVYLAFFAGQGTPTVPNQWVEAPDTDLPAVAVARLVSSESAQWSGQAIAAGDPVYDRTYTLTEGSALLRMGGGAMVRLEAPASVRLRAEDALTLRSGRLLGYCDAQSGGLMVETSHARFVDLGTEFGVIVEPGRKSELHVFAGVVEAIAIRPDGSASASARVSSGQATRIVAGADAPVAMTSDPALFAAARPVDLKLRDGGQGLSADKPLDPDWSVVALDGQAMERPLAARLFDLGALNENIRARFLPNTPGGSAWLTLPTDDFGSDATQVTFERTIDLAGMDPDTAELTIRLIADNYVISVWLNDQSLYETEPVEDLDDVSKLFNTFATLTVSDGFKPGINTIRIVIDKSGSTSGARLNPTGLRVELEGRAQRLWHSPGQRPARP